MDEELHQELVTRTAKLKARLSSYCTEDVVFRFARYGLEQTNNPEHVDTLTSPSRQTSFVLSLMLTTQPPTNPKQFDDAAWTACETALNEIFGCYRRMYFREGGQATAKNGKDTAQQVAMSAFLYYFNTGFIANTHQIAKRIRVYLTPHDKFLKEVVGISASACLTICEAVTDRAQATVNRLLDVMKEEKLIRHRLLGMREAEGWTRNQYRAEARRQNWAEKFDSMKALQHELLRLRRSDLESRFGLDGAAFWNLLTVERGGGPPVEYLTDELVYDRRPLIVTDKDEAVFFMPNSLYTASLEVLEGSLLVSTACSSYLRSRDRTLEDEGADALLRILPNAASHRGVFETRNRQYEHDLVVLDGRTLFAVEMKASPPTTPFRDPNKAFERVSRAFKSDRGPQKAYEQGLRLWRRWKAGETLELFDAHGKKVLDVLPDAIDNVFIIGVTRDGYGPLTCDLSLLLEKAPTDPYPWMIDVFALDALADGWRYFKWGLAELTEFLRARLALHGKVWGSDELEYAGFFIQHGLDQLRSETAERIQLDASDSNVFHDVWMAEHYGGPPVRIERKRVQFHDVAKLLAEMSTQFAPTPERRQGRNERCHCGSGKKFKKCHGQPQSAR